MPIAITEDIRSITDLKRNMREVLDQTHRTLRPVILTVNGKADAVLLSAKTFEQYLQIHNLARLLLEAEQQNTPKANKQAVDFFREFKNAYQI